MHFFCCLLISHKGKAHRLCKPYVDWLLPFQRWLLLFFLSHFPLQQQPTWNVVLQVHGSSLSLHLCSNVTQQKILLVHLICVQQQTASSLTRCNFLVTYHHVTKYSFSYLSTVCFLSPECQVHEDRDCSCAHSSFSPPSTWFGCRTNWYRVCDQSLPTECQNNLMTY